VGQETSLLHMFPTLEDLPKDWNTIDSRSRTNRRKTGALPNLGRKLISLGNAASWVKKPFFYTYFERMKTFPKIGIPSILGQYQIGERPALSPIWGGLGWGCYRNQGQLTPTWARHASTTIKKGAHKGICSNYCISPHGKPGFQHGQCNQGEHDKWRVFFALEDDLASLAHGFSCSKA